MARIAPLLALAAVLGLVLASCAERESPSDSEIEAHPDGWASPVGEPFHGSFVAQSGVESCRACHGADLMGKGAANDCFECHAGGPSGHPARSEWLDPSSQLFHANAVAESGPGPCAMCHGEDYRGGWSGVSCYTCHARGPSGHPEGWFAPPDPDFHGAEVARTGPEPCQACHGTDYRGGTSGVSCYTCHGRGPSGHPAGWLIPPDPDFHGAEVARTGPEPCQTCHGADYRGGTSGVSCYTCHAGGPSGHPDGWLDPTDRDFHGQAVIESGTDDCARCHGADLGGGTSGVACSRCHG